MVAVDMKRLFPATGLIPPHKLPNRESNSFECRFWFGFNRKEVRRRKLKLVVTAGLSKAFSLNLGLDSQTVQSHDVSQEISWIGPVPGDIAEIEAYCRIFRAAERLHAALMDTLCNPLTGECTVSYDFTPEEKPLVEDKIVSVLGCMISLLNKGREDVISGRSSVMSMYQNEDAGVVEDKLPPLAVFRSEMKRCGESLHVALENYLTPDDYRSLEVWRKLQRLKNVCYDAGFPRKENHPCHTLIANWEPVYFSTSEDETEAKDSEVAFFRGGQVTDEGLKWLIDKGVKTIVDLRAESVKDNFYQAAIDDAILCAKVELIKIPVEVGMAPSMEQVEKLASLVSDCSKRPIYLHSREGVWRTSAMVSRWRQYMTRFASQFSTNQSISPNGTGKLLEPKIGGDSPNLQEVANEILTSNGVHKESSKDDLKAGGTESNLSSHTPEDASNNGAGPPRYIYENTDPFKAQIPPSNVFSRNEMSRFLRNKKTSPPTYYNLQIKRLEKLPISREAHVKTAWSSEGVGNDPQPSLAERELTNVSFKGKNQDLENRSVSTQPTGNEVYINGAISTGIGPYADGIGKEGKSTLTETNTTSLSKNIDVNDMPISYKESQKTNGKPTVPRDGDVESIEGDMCASATGVVRVQSRKKAEMFLVRTDGFSCTREKVTEASLAFTHPSTQQQMLMWKSTPKTVLLLKKLGQELMEHAKEVASYLYYKEKMNVLVEPDVHDIFARMPGFGFIQTFYSQDTSDLHERVDFVACLGGDGVILHASNLFRGPVPPVVSFSLGSLGFLTSHRFEDYKQDLRQVIHGNSTADAVYITLRMRLRCEIFRNGKAVPGKIFDVLNEVVIDRGSNPYLSKIECYEHGRLITKVQGDGVIIATPTGSTAYSTSAGGSMVHPNVPCMLFTPICPHSLSFRPVILPDSARLELKIPEDARSNAWVSFDGKRRQQLSRGDSVGIFMSQHPLPTVNKSDQTGDWFHSLIRCLNWNERLEQKAL